MIQDSLPAKFSLAESFLVDGQVDAALQQYREIADSYARDGLLVKAIGVYKKMLEIRPDSKEVEQLLSDLAKQKDSVSSLDIESKLLKNLSYEEFREFVRNFILRHYDEDTIIVKEGDPGESLFIIVRGEVRVMTRDLSKREIVLSNLGDGDLFGEVSLLTGKPRTATVMTNMATELLELSRSDYKKLIEQYPRIQRVVEALHQARADRTVEAMIQAYREKGKN